MNDSAYDRQQRLAAMRGRRAPTTGMQDSGVGASNTLFQARPNNRGKGGMGGRRHAAGAVVMRLRKILTEPAPDSPVIPGTPVREANVAELIRLLKQRAASPEAKGTKLANQVIQFLTKDDGGEKTVDGVSIAQLKKFLAFAVKKASKG